MKLALITLTFFAFVTIPFAYHALQSIAEVRSLVGREVDLSRVADGTYTGAYHKGRWTYEVEVVVRDHRIASVKHLGSRMRAVEDWGERTGPLILAKQTVNLDVISGAVALTTPQTR